MDFLGGASKFMGPASLIAGVGMDLFGSMFGKTDTERRQDFLREQSDKAGKAFERGLGSKDSRFAQRRILSGVDREAGMMRGRASGSASKARQRIRGTLGVAGIGMAEGIAGGIRQAGSFQSSKYLSDTLGGFDQQASAEALQEAQGRRDSVLASIYGQPLQDPRANIPSSKASYGREAITDLSDYFGTYFG